MPALLISVYLEVFSRAIISILGFRIRTVSIQYYNYNITLGIRRRVAKQILYSSAMSVML